MHGAPALAAGLGSGLIVVLAAAASAASASAAVVSARALDGGARHDGPSPYGSSNTTCVPGFPESASGTLTTPTFCYELATAAVMPTSGSPPQQQQRREEEETEENADEEDAAVASASRSLGPTAPSPLTPLVTLLGSLGSAPPPAIFWTPTPSPQCAAVNGGELTCCRGALAGDVQLVVFLAQLYGYSLNPDDITGVDCDNNLSSCPGVELCCQVTALNPLLSFYCEDYIS
ncbi:hypothetical protein GGR56DRAFT_675547 [Xylariaceae sp. FL0804]|nr:hypothetical protein GGR56DRAFT_675547 [Xylariaceae sp. FL0804]